MSAIKPMKAKHAARVPADPNGDRVIEIKYDGWRCIAHRTTDGVDLRTGSGKAIVGPEYIMEALMCLPAGTILDGEMVGKPGAEWNQAQSVCSRQRKHIVCEASPALTFHVFDVLAYDGEDQQGETFRDRRNLVENIVEEVVNDVNVAVAEQFPCTEDACLAVLVRGFEGVVVKPWNGRYVQGDRGLWLKVKPFEEIEGVCTGTYEATEDSKFDGRAVGGITFTITHEDGTTYDGKCAGKMNDTLREDLLTNPGKYVGLVVEIIHWGINEGGALRHPNFRRFRDPADKAAPSVQPPVTKPSGARPRNYGSMGDEKLLTTALHIEQGNGKPNDNRDHCLAEARKRNLI